MTPYLWVRSNNVIKRRRFELKFIAPLKQKYDIISYKLQDIIYIFQNTENELFSCENEVQGRKTQYKKNRKKYVQWLLITVCQKVGLVAYKWNVSS